MDGSANDIDEGFVIEISESQTPLRSYIWKLVGNMHDTDDVLQKTNVVLWQKRMEWDPETVFLKWAYRVAYFQVKAHFRDLGRDRQRFHFDEALLELLAHEEPNFSNSSQLMDALEGCLAKMDPKKRDLILRRYEGEVSVEALADESGYSANSFSQLLRRMRSKLSDCIGTQLKLGASASL